jgi:prepilin-type N-terminal cleavage/methylation domain-containing protein
MSLRPSLRPRPPVRGFTLIELLVTIAIAAILMALAAPALKTAICSRAVVSQSAELLEGLHFARSEAMKRSGPVTICKTTVAAPTTCAAGGTWANWMVFAEKAGGATGVRESAEASLRQHAQASSSWVTWAATTPANVNFVTFQSTGIALSDNGGGGVAPASMTIPVKPTLDNAAAQAVKNFTRQVCLNAQGRASVVDGNLTCP